MSDSLKVDQAIGIVNNERYLLLTNVNIPEEYLQIDILPQVLSRIQNLITRMYLSFDVEYEISATYDLLIGETGQTRRWTGSFVPRLEFIPCIKNCSTFNEQTFVRENTLILINRQGIIQKLTGPGITSGFKFFNLQSVIFNIQGIVPKYHPPVLRVNLTFDNRRKRTVIQDAEHQPQQHHISTKTVSYQLP